MAGTMTGTMAGAMAGPRLDVNGGRWSEEERAGGMGGRNDRPRNLHWDSCFGQRLVDICSLKILPGKIY